MKQRKQLKQYMNQFKQVVKRFDLFNLNAQNIEDRQCMQDLMKIYYLITHKHVSWIKRFLDGYLMFDVLEDLICYYLSGDYQANNYAVYDKELYHITEKDINKILLKNIK